MPKSQNLGCLGSLLSLFSPSSKKTPALHFPYGLRDDFLSPAELSFYHVLKIIVTEHQQLITKVNLADLFFVRQPHNNRAARNRIDRKHVDFVLCDRKTMQPLLGIELDDSSHQKKARQERDAFVDEVFRAADLPILHIPAARSYQPNELLAQINNKLSSKPPAIPDALTP